MASLVKHGELEMRVRNIPPKAQGALKTINGLLRPENHPVTLPREMEHLRVALPKRHQTVEQHLRLGDLESSAQRAACIREREQILRVLARCLFEQRHRFI